jgi:hypothetical protein
MDEVQRQLGEMLLLLLLLMEHHRYYCLPSLSFKSLSLSLTLVFHRNKFMSSLSLSPR